MVNCNPYCIGGKSITHGKLYNYLFRYDYTDDLKPKKLVIKVTNNQHINDGFNIYLRKGNNTYIEPTDFVAEKTYGEKEEYQKTLMPYIIDLDYIRGEDKNDYVSKLLKTELICPYYYSLEVSCLFIQILI